MVWRTDTYIYVLHERCFHWLFDQHQELRASILGLVHLEDNRCPNVWLARVLKVVAISPWVLQFLDQRRSILGHMEHYHVDLLRYDRRFHRHHSRYRGECGPSLSTRLALVVVDVG